MGWVGLLTVLMEASSGLFLLANFLSLKTKQQKKEATSLLFSGWKISPFHVTNVHDVPCFVQVISATCKLQGTFASSKKKIVIVRSS